MHQHSSKWTGAQDVSGAHLKEVMQRLGGGSTIQQQALNSGIYNIKEYHNMASSGVWGVERSTLDRESRPTVLSTQGNTTQKVSSVIKLSLIHI